jgi:hypothetical protein
VTTVYTLAQYQALAKSLALGVTRVTVEGRTTEFQTAADMMKTLAMMKAELEQAGLLPPPEPPSVRRFRIGTWKGL